MSEAGSGNEACVCVNETKVTTDSEKIAIEVAAIVSRSNEQRCALADGVTTMSLQLSVHAADHGILAPGQR
jgi:hypothetical protein